MKLNELTESINKKILDRVAIYTTGDFLCHDINLTSLEGCPTLITGDFICSTNKLTSLEGFPKEVKGNVDFNHNKLTSLEGCPTKIDGFFDCSDNKLTSLRGCSVEVSGNFYCYGNRLTSLDGCPEIVGKGFYINNNDKLTSLVGIHKHLKSCVSLHFDTNMITEGGIGLLLIKNLTYISTINVEPFEIIEKYLGQGVKGLPRCQQELIDAGYEKFAKL